MIPSRTCGPFSSRQQGQVVYCNGALLANLLNGLSTKELDQSPVALRRFRSVDCSLVYINKFILKGRKT